MKTSKLSNPLYKGGSPKYYVTLIPGLEDIAWTDIQAKLKSAHLIESSQGRLLFTYPDDPNRLPRLRSVEDVFVFVGNIEGITRSRRSLGDIFRGIARFDLEPALMIHKEIHGGKGKKRLTFRVISSMVGRHNFRRADVQTAVESSIIKRYGWKIDMEVPTLEFRIDLEGEEALFGLRLTDERIRRKTYKVAHIPASLPPTVAYCMALLSDPNPSDYFVDPMCGAGTIVIERTLVGPYKQVIGGDIEEVAVRSARSNVSASRRSVDLFLWDVSAMPIRDHTMDKVVCNLPFGKQTGFRSENRALYSVFFKEMVRILKPGGKAVLLTSEHELMRELTLQYPSLNLKNSLRIDLSGVKAYIYVLSFK